MVNGHVPVWEPEDMLGVAVHRLELHPYSQELFSCQPENQMSNYMPCPKGAPRVNDRKSVLYTIILFLQKLSFALAWAHTIHTQE